MSATNNYFKIENSHVVFFDDTSEASIVRAVEETHRHAEEIRAEYEKRGHVNPRVSVVLFRESPKHFLQNYGTIL